MIYPAFLSATQTDIPAEIVSENTINYINSISELLAKYGGFIVILAVFIIIFIAIVSAMIYTNNKMMKSSLEEKISILNKQSYQNDKMLDHILKDDEEVIVPPIKATTSDNVVDSNQHTKRKDLVGTYIDINLILKDAVRMATNKLKAERVAIYVFHNGNESVHGLPFFKASCIYEWTKSGSTAMKTRPYRTITHHSIPLYMLSEIVESIYNDKKYTCTNVQSKLEYNDCLRTFVEHSDIDSIYALAIEDDAGTIGGFIVAEFKNNLDLLQPECVKRIHRTLEGTSETVKPVVINLNGQYTISHEQQ